MSKPNARETAMTKLSEAAYRFSKEKDGLWLQHLDGAIISKQTFREQLKTGINCKLNEEELSALMIDFDKEGLVDGAKFCLFFSRLRYELKSKLHSDLLANRRKAKEMLRAGEAANKLDSDKRNADLANTEFSSDDRELAMNKLKEAAYKYDRLMPGAIQLDAFDAKTMSPLDFKDQLFRLFKIQVNQRELAALMRLYRIKDIL